MAGCSREEALERCKKWNMRNRPPLNIDELRRTVDSAFTREYTMKFRQSPKLFDINEELELVKSKEEVKPADIGKYILENNHIITTHGDEEILVYREGFTTTQRRRG